MIGQLLHIYGILVFAFCSLIFLITASNIVWLEHTLTSDRKKTSPSVAVLISAHNDAGHIGHCLDSLLKQDYSPYQIYAIDDNSSDGTWEILKDYMLRYPRKLRAYKAEVLPEHRYGKARAVQELSLHAKEEYLVSTEPDTFHRSDSIGKAIAIAEKYHADLVTGYAGRRMSTFSEAATEPAMYFLSLFSLPLYLIPFTKSPALSLATSQLMCFRHAFFKEIGGYEEARNYELEHLKIARAVKRHGGKVVFVDVKDTVESSKPSKYHESMQSVAKNAFSYLGGNFIYFALVTIAIPLFFLVPILAWGISSLSLSRALPYLKASTIVVFYTCLLGTIDRRFPWYVPFIYPIIAVNALRALWRGSRLPRDVARRRAQS